MNIKGRYFKNRLEFENKPFSKTNIHDKNFRLAKREINTLQNLFRISSCQDFICFQDKNVLDLGSGNNFLKAFLEEKGAIYHPLDYDICDFNKDKFPFENESFDLIISLAVIEHIENITNFMNEASRVLKSGGFVYFSTPNFRFSYKSFYDDPTHVRPFTEKSMEQLLNIWDFKYVNVFPGARCKSDWFYRGKFRFHKCAYLPFRSDYENSYVPKFFKGKATSIIGFGQKID